MRVSGQFRHQNRGANRGFCAARRARSFRSPLTAKCNTRCPSRNLRHSIPTVLDAEYLQEARSKPAINAGPQAPASPARKTRTKTCRAKFCWPMSVRFRANPLTASAGPSACKSLRAARFPPAKSSWPPGSSRGKAWCFQPTNSTLRALNRKSSSFYRYKSHIRNFTDFLSKILTRPFLYAFPGSSKPKLRNRCRPFHPAGVHTGGQHGEIYMDRRENRSIRT